MEIIFYYYLLRHIKSEISSCILAVCFWKSLMSSKLFMLPAICSASFLISDWVVIAYSPVGGL